MSCKTTNQANAKRVATSSIAESKIKKAKDAELSESTEGYDEFMESYQTQISNHHAKHIISDNKILLDKKSFIDSYGNAAVDQLRNSKNAKLSFNFYVKTAEVVMLYNSLFQESNFERNFIHNECIKLCPGASRETVKYVKPAVFDRWLNIYLREKFKKQQVDTDLDNEIQIFGCPNYIYLDGDYVYLNKADNTHENNLKFAKLYFDVWIRALKRRGYKKFTYFIFSGGIKESAPNKGGFHIFIVIHDHVEERELAKEIYENEVFQEIFINFTKGQGRVIVDYIKSTFALEGKRRIDLIDDHDLKQIFDKGPLYVNSGKLLPFGSKRWQGTKKRVYTLVEHNFTPRDDERETGGIKLFPCVHKTIIKSNKILPELDGYFSEDMFEQYMFFLSCRDFVRDGGERSKLEYLISNLHPLAKLFLKVIWELDITILKTHPLWAKLNTGQEYLQFYLHIVNMILVGVLLNSDGILPEEYGARTIKKEDEVGLFDVICIAMFVIRRFVKNTVPESKKDPDRVKTSKILYRILETLSNDRCLYKLYFHDDLFVKNRVKVLKGFESDADDSSTGEEEDESANQRPARNTEVQIKVNRDNEGELRTKAKLMAKRHCEIAVKNFTFFINKHLLMPVLDGLKHEFWHTFECHGEKQTFRSVWQQFYHFYYIIAGANDKWNVNIVKHRFLKSVTRQFLLRDKENTTDPKRTHMYIYNMLQLEEMYQFPYNQWILDSEGFSYKWIVHIDETIMNRITQADYCYYHGNYEIQNLIKQSFEAMIGSEGLSKAFRSYFTARDNQKSIIKNIHGDILCEARKISSISAPAFNSSELIPVRNGLLSFKIKAKRQANLGKPFVPLLDQIITGYGLHANVIEDYNFDDASKHNFGVVLTRYSNMPFSMTEYQNYRRTAEYNRVFAETKKIANCDAIEHDFLMTYLSYGLHSIGSRDTLLILNGSGSDGKTTLMNIVKLALGGEDNGNSDYVEKICGEYMKIQLKNPASYISSMSSSVLVEKSKGSGAHDENGRINLLDSRLCILEEVDSSKNTTFNSAVIKELTGGGEINARKIYGQGVTFKVNSLIVFVVNHIPKFLELDTAIRRRIICFTHMTKFVQDNVKQQSHSPIRVDNIHTFDADTSFLTDFQANIKYRQALFYMLLDKAIQALSDHGNSLSDIKLSPMVQTATNKMFESIAIAEECDNIKVNPVDVNINGDRFKELTDIYQKEFDIRVEQGTAHSLLPRRDSDEAPGNTTAPQYEDTSQGNDEEKIDVATKYDIFKDYPDIEIAEKEAAFIPVIQLMEDSIKAAMDSCSAKHQARYTTSTFRKSILEKIVNRYHFDLVYIPGDRFKWPKCRELRDTLTKDQKLLYDYQFKIYMCLKRGNDNVQEYRFNDRAYDNLYIMNHTYHVVTK